MGRCPCRTCRYDLILSLRGPSPDDMLPCLMKIGGANLKLSINHFLRGGWALGGSVGSYDLF